MIGDLVTIDNKKSWPNLKGVVMTVFSISEVTDSIRLVSFPLSKFTVGVRDLDGNEYNQFEEFIQPIKLTEEILIKNCGFTKYTWFNGCFINTKHGDLMIRFFGNEIHLFFTNIMYDSQGMKFKNPRYVGNTNSTQNIKYLHELQNLYFALTKQELEITF